MSSDTFTNKSPNHGDNKNDTNNNKNKTPLSHYLINEAFDVLVSEHAFLSDTHNTLCANYRSLERDLRWYSDTLVAVQANYQQLEVNYQQLEVDYEQLEAAHRALEAERDDAVGENARMGLKAKRGTFGGRMSIANHAQHPDQQGSAREVQQSNNFINQQPLQGHINTTPSPIQQQQQQAFQPQQAQYPPIPITAQEVQQLNNFVSQQPLQSQFKATPPPIQQQPAFQPQTQQSQYPPFPNAHQQPQDMPQYAHGPPLAQGQGFGTPLDAGHAGAGAGDAGGGDKDRKNSLTRAKLQFKGRDIWVGGESKVGRKGKDGEWTEVRGCSVM
ncbi:hypothetical protein MBLNU13_g05363t1 [Cladosporium sp. NU13]